MSNETVVVFAVKIVANNPNVEEEFNTVLPSVLGTIANLKNVEVTSVYNSSNVKDPKEEVKTPEDQAVIFLGTLFAKEIANPLAFANALMHSLNTDSTNKSEIKKSIKILSQETLVVSKKLLKKFKFDESTFNVIKFVNQYINNYVQNV